MFTFASTDTLATANVFAMASLAFVFFFVWRRLHFTGGPWLIAGYGVGMLLFLFDSHTPFLHVEAEARDVGLAMVCLFVAVFSVAIAEASGLDRPTRWRFAGAS